MAILIRRSPAKLNLFLQVVNKRSDGYHNLRTLFERIDLCDELRLVSRTDGCVRIFCDHPQVPLGQTNLAYRAALSLQEEYCLKQGVDIHIRKRIPVAAGLAGGSSNAATTLLGLNQLWGLHLNPGELWRIGRGIGSDVPFFLAKTSWAIGLERGDKILPQQILAKIWHVLVVPRVRMLTPKVYGALDLKKLTKPKTNVNILLRSLKLNNISKAKELFSNDLETGIREICPRILGIKNRLEDHLGQGVCFSGSGPSIFGVMTSRQEAEDAKKILSQRYSQVFVVRTL
jgi:4-diphosphocytidyl-2-C-methyl-D-erythritol kinase